MFIKLSEIMQIYLPIAEVSVNAFLLLGLGGFVGVLSGMFGVGGVGIANVMSISVIQRSGEIGIRRALGHTKTTIALQFVLEALFVGVLGGIAGVVTGVCVIYLVSSILGWIATLNIPLFLVAGGMALIVSVIAGLYPAWKAARLEPLETLRLG